MRKKPADRNVIDALPLARAHVQSEIVEIAAVRFYCVRGSVALPQVTQEIISGTFDAGTFHAGSFGGRLCDGAFPPRHAFAFPRG
jgi:hypothetical protein